MLYNVVVVRSDEEMLENEQKQGLCFSIVMLYDVCNEVMLNLDAHIL